MSTFTKRAVLGLAIMMGLSALAQADTVFLADKPSSILKPSDAAKQSKTKPVYKCEQVKQGPNINPVKVQGTNTIWASEVGNGIDNAGDQLADGKKIFRCKSVAMDESTGRMKSATAQ